MFLQGKAQRRINAVHILDALVLNGTDVRDQHFNQRSFAEPISKLFHIEIFFFSYITLNTK